MINSQDKKSKISLLQNVSGYLNPGEMSALVRCSRAFNRPRMISGISFGLQSKAGSCLTRHVLSRSHCFVWPLCATAQLLRQVLHRCDV